MKLPSVVTVLEGDENRVLRNGKCHFKNYELYEIGIFKQGDYNPSATGHFVHVYVRPGEMEPISVPDRVREGLQRLVVAD